MFNWDILHSAFRAILSSPTRALLTTLGIVIGIASVITMMEIGNGSSTALRKSVENMGANNFVVFPGSANTGGMRMGRGTKISLTPEDCQAIENECSHVLAAAPIVWGGGQIVWRDQNWSPNQVQGTGPSYLTAKNWNEFHAGQMFTEEDVANAAQVCVIGKTIAQEVFKDVDPVGQEIRIRSLTVKVLGVLKAKGANMFGHDQDDIVLVPWTTLRFRISGNRTGVTSTTTTTTTTSTSDLYPSTGPDFYPAASTSDDTLFGARSTSLNMIMVTAKSTEEIPLAQEEIRKLLRDRHRLAPGIPDDFDIRTFGEMTESLKNTSKTMTNLLLCVAMISLIVGGVGIMNIMLVSVTERTREIGLRMAIGARGKDILCQFLIESIVLCTIGGIIGIGLGVGGSELINYFLGWPIESSPVSIVASVVVSVIVGVLFGFYPAWKASRLDPIEALRYE